VSPLQSHAKPGKSEPTHVGCYDEKMLAVPANFRFASIRVIRVECLFPSGFWILHPVFSAAMFETVTTEITTATGKLTHLRRFL
jgi:hypothetical protein